jgi:polar amino acid transport system permease protein
MLEFLPILLRGATITIEITAAASALAIFFAFASGLARLSSVALLRRLSLVYIELFRGTSLLVQLFWLFFVLPHFGIKLSPFQTAVIGLALNIGAYGGEVVRSAVLAVPAGQTMSAMALGLEPTQVMRYVILPQAARIAVAPTVGFSVQVIKGTALASIIGFIELTKAGTMLNNATFRPFLVYSLVALIYFCLCFPLSFLAKRLEGRLNVAR